MGVGLLNISGIMKKYKIKVYYTVVDTVDVESDDVFWAIEEARETSFRRSLNDMEVVDVECYSSSNNE